MTVAINEPVQSVDAAPILNPRANHQQLLASLDVTVPRTSISTGYGLALGLLAVWLALIPLVYLALLGFMAYLVIWHLSQAVVTFSDGPFFLFHVPMAFLGGLLLLFLIKPVFFRKRPKEEPVLSLREEDEPLLFAYVRKLCQATGSKPPARIEVDCDANAHARLRRGFFSVVGGDLVLRIGLPLAADLSLRQFTGVLAHEFGHFNQRNGMSASYLIRRLTRFFAQIVFQRDKLDERLMRHRKSHNGFRQAYYWLMIGPIEAARGVLWLMLVIGELLTCGVLRRMEYDADRMEALVAGTGDFIKTSRSLAFLQLASRLTRADLAETWEDKRLADDLPGLIAANGRHLVESRPELLARLEREKTRWLDTHPSDADRIRAVQGLDCAALLQCDASAGLLFSDFDALCRQATQVFYRAIVGDKAKDAQLIPTPVLAAERVAQRKAYRTLRRFLRGHVAPMQPVFPNSDAERPLDDLESGLAALKNTRQTMLSAAGSVGPGMAKFQSDAATMAAARAQITLCGLFTRSPQAGRLRARATKTLGQTQPMHGKTRQEYQNFSIAARARLTTALRLLQTDGIPFPRAGGGEEYVAATRSRAAQLILVCRALEPLVAPMNRLGELAITIRVLAPSHNSRQPFQPLIRQILGATNEATDILRGVWKQLSTIPFPFAHATQGVSIGTVLVANFPDGRDPVNTHTAAVAALEAYSMLVVRTLAELTQHAEQVEEAANFEAIPDIEETREDSSKERQAAWRYWLSYGGRALAGVAMFSGLVWLSLNPPVLPAMPWDDGSAAGGYQPNSFHVPFTPPPTYNPSPYNPSPYGPNGNHFGPTAPGGPRNPGMPGNPMMPQGPRAPQRPGSPRQPGYPGSSQPGGARPWYQPSPSPQPGPSGPSRYSPSPSPGGGGYGGSGYGGGGGGRGGGGGGGHR